MTDRVLDKVKTALDVLIETGARHEGLLPSLIDLETHRMLRHLPPAIDGQRPGDRAPLGSNLMHDQHVLKVLLALGPALGKPEYTEAAQAYLQRFATHCTDTVTGLFPWGEHSYWHLEEDRVGDSHRNRDPDRPAGQALHDHLRQAPVWLWEELYAQEPRCVERFAEGLDYHFKEDGHSKDGEPREYIRHAHIEQRTRLERGPKSADFPRHSGFYLLDWAVAWLKTGRADFLAQVEGMVDYWWPHRDAGGLLLIHTRCPESTSGQYQINSVSQTLSLAASLLDAAALLETEAARAPGRADLAPLIDRMRERAGTYTEGFLGAPHDVKRGVFAYGCRRGTGELTRQMPIWGSVYGQWPAAYQALIALCVYRHTGDERLLAWARAAGRVYLSQPFPDDAAVPVSDAGLAVELLADLYDLTGDDGWRQDGLALAFNVMDVYLEGDLPRAAPGAGHYESQTVPGDLLHGLARLALLSESRRDCPLTPNYTCR